VFIVRIALNIAKTLCGQTVELVNVTTDGAHVYR